MNYSLSDIDIEKLLDGKCKILRYPDFRKYNSLTELMGPHKCIVILYLAQPHYGHWCCAWLSNNDTTFNFFDSYAVFIDDQLKFNSKQKNIMLQQACKYLTHLIIKDPKIDTINFNEYQFQKFKKGVNTCGRWVVLRLLLKHLNEDQFYDLFKNKKDMDRAVVKITDYIANKKGFELK